MASKRSEDAGQRCRPPQWARIRRQVLNRDRWQCQCCGSRGSRFEVDHIRPLMYGGSDDLSNLQVLCRRCHVAKSAAERGGPLSVEWTRKLAEYA